MLRGSNCVPVALLVFVASTPVARAQTAGDPPPRLQNRVHVRIQEYLDEEQTQRHTRQPFSVVVQDEGSTFLLDHDRYFYGRPKLKPKGRLFKTGFRSSVGVSRIHVRTPTPGLSVGNKRSDPDITKPGQRPRSKPTILGGGSEAGYSDDSDSSVLYGPEFSVPIKEDLAEWDVTSWMPSGSSFGVRARLLFGEFEVFGRESDLELYSLGPTLGVPILAEREATVHAVLTAGPAFLRTDIGDALGVDVGASLESEIPITGNLGIVAGIGVNLFFAENVHTWGPAVNVGLSLAW